jgi:ABC-type Fe3+-hydroxamate transport system substrate-binding protein
VGDSLTLSWKLSGTAATAVITDGQGNTVVADATTSSSAVVSPTATTTYTLTVNGGAVADVTVTTETPIRITSAGFNAGGFFEVTAEGLARDVEYDLFWSDDLVDWTPVGVPLVADETGIGTFADTVSYDPQTPVIFYRVEKLAP